MKVNIRTGAPRTHEGAVAAHLKPIQELRRSTLACMLWEDTFYESGEDVAKRIASLVPRCDPKEVAELAIEAREKMKLRHAPLFIVREMVRHASHKPLVSVTLERVIQRADELAEFLAIYWKDGSAQPIPAQVKKGLARAFSKFNEYHFAKYNRAGAVKLRDVLFLTHARPHDVPKGTAHYTRKARKSLEPHALTERELLFQLIAQNRLATPDTWEVGLSAGKDKRQTFERLMEEKKLGALAFLRNLRNMDQAGVPRKIMEAYLEALGLERVLPFRFIAAARAVPGIEPMIERAMLRALAEQKKLPGKTALVVDNSGSMDAKLSDKSDLSRRDAASALGVLLREICEECTIVVFSDHATIAPPRHGFALVDAISNATEHGSTNTALAVELAQHERPDRIIVLTDEQSHQTISAPGCRGYFVNVASYKNGIGYGPWLHVDGWSEAIIDYIRAFEREVIASALLVKVEKDNGADR